MRLFLTPLHETARGAGGGMQCRSDGDSRDEEKPF